MGAIEERSRNLVSVIIPTYNRAELLSRCLKSVFSQDYKAIEVIIVDDDSKDDFNEIKKIYSGKIKIVRNDYNFGPSYSRNAGALISRGEYLLFIDSDTELFNPGIIASMVDILKNDKGVGSVGGVGIFDSQGILEKVFAKIYSNSLINEKIYISKSEFSSAVERKECDHLMGCNVMLRQEDFATIGGFDPYYFYLGEDRELGLRIKKLGKVNCLSWKASSRHEAYAKPNCLQVQLKSCLRLALKIFGIGEFLGMKMRLRDLKSVSLAQFFQAVFWNINNYSMTVKARSINFLSTARLEEYRKMHIFESLRKTKGFNVPKRLDTPHNLVFFITSKCNLKCKHCFLPENKQVMEKSELELSQIEKIFKSLNKTRHLILTGGEPVLRTDFAEIVRLAIRYGGIREIVVASNGFFFDDIETATKKIMDLGSGFLLTFQISIDGIGATHDSIRGVKGGFTNALKTVSVLLELKKQYPNLEYLITTTIMKDNINEIESIVRFFYTKKLRHKLSFVRGNDFSTFGVPKEILNPDYQPRDKNEELSLGEISKALSKIEHEFPDYFSGYQRRKISLVKQILKSKKRAIPCLAGYVDGVLYENGDVAICEQAVAFGNLREAGLDFRLLWNSSASYAHRAKLLDCSCIHGCNISSNLNRLKAI